MRVFLCYLLASMVFSLIYLRLSRVRSVAVAESFGFRCLVSGVLALAALSLVLVVGL